MSILYCVVARGTVVLVEFSAVTGNMGAVARRILEKLPLEAYSRLCFSQDRYIFHILRSEGLTFVCLANDTFGRRFPFAYLEDIQMRFMENYGKVARYAPAYAMNDEFSRVLHQQMEFYSSNSSADTLGRVNGEVGEFRTMVAENIEKILGRNNRIELLVDKTATMQDSAKRLFLGAYPHNSFSSPLNIQENELSEYDIFSTGDFSEASNHLHRNSPPSTGSSPRHLHNKTAFAQTGILAVLPDHNTNSHNHLYQKTAITSPSSSSSSSFTTSSSRFIPSIPKPPQERLPTSSGNHKNQARSAPVKVSVMETMRRRQKEFDEIEEEEDDDGDGDGEMLPPHEIVARQQSPMLSCSVLEGVGRTLKGRDLRQVRNAIWRRTGFLD